MSIYNHMAELSYPMLSLPSGTSGPPSHPRDQNLQHCTPFGEMLI